MGIRRTYPERDFEYEFDEDIWYLSASPKTSTLNIEMSGITHPDAQYSVRRSANWDMYVIEYVRRGAGFIDCGGKHYPLGAGDAYILRSFTSHAYRADPSDPFEKLWVNVSGALVEHLLTAYNLLDSVMVRHVNLEAHFSRLRAAIEPHYDAEQAAGAIAGLLIAFAHGGKQTAARNLTAPERLKDYIDRNTMNGVTAERAAAMLGITPAHARRLFRRQYGVTVHQYISERLLITAKQLLTTSDYSVGEISDLLGYCDDNYFSAVFKRQFGLSPMQFRQSVKKPAACNKERV